MTSNKSRVEPDIEVPDELESAPDESDDARTAEIEELVASLEEEIAREEAEAEDREPTIEEVIAALEAERDEMRDKWTRALAEAENVRRRAERDRRDAAAYGGTQLARDLLSVYDNLDRALQATDDELREVAASFIEGVELTQRELIHAFSKHKIERITPETGERFDPNHHQAMFEAPIPGAVPGTVIECMQDGFVISDRLLRPALVGVAKAMPDAEGDAGEAEDVEDDGGE